MITVVSDSWKKSKEMIAGNGGQRNSLFYTRDDTCEGGKREEKETKCERARRDVEEDSLAHEMQ